MWPSGTTECNNLTARQKYNNKEMALLAQQNIKINNNNIIYNSQVCWSTDGQPLPGPFIIIYTCADTNIR